MSSDDRARTGAEAGPSPVGRVPVPLGDQSRDQSPTSGPARTLQEYQSRHGQENDDEEPAIELISGVNPDGPEPEIFDKGFESYLIEVQERCMSEDRSRMWAWRSLYMFSLNNRFRQLAIRTMETKAFGVTIQLLILANTVFLAMSSKEPGFEETSLGRFINDAEYFFTAAFITEMMIKVVAMGFIGAPGTYLRDGWNVLDFIVVVMGVIPMLPFIPAAGNLSAIRVVRVFRPLRSIQGIKGMRVLVTTIIRSFPMLLDVVLLCAFVFFILGIVGINLFAGTLRNRCMVPTLPDPTAAELGAVIPANSGLVVYAFAEGGDEDWAETMCSGRLAEDTELTVVVGPGGRDVTWVEGSNDIGGRGGGFECPWSPEEGVVMLCADYGENPNGNNTSFDNIMWAWLTIFQCITLEGWVDVTYLLEDAYSPAVWAYSFVLILLGAFFMINLFLAVLYLYFTTVGDQADAAEKAETERVKALAEEGEEDAMEHLKQLAEMEEAKKVLSVDDMPEELANARGWWGAVRRRCWGLYFNTRFEALTSALIILNTAVMASEHWGMTQTHRDVAEAINYVLTAYFTVELAIKMLGVGQRNFWRHGMNAFDGVIVAASLLEIIIAAAVPNLNMASLSVLRSFRIFRLFKLVRSWKELQRLLQTMMRSLESISYLSLIMAICIIIFALLGMELFGYKFESCDMVEGSEQFCAGPGHDCPKHYDCYVDCDAAQAGSWVPVEGSPYGGMAYCEGFEAEGLGVVHKAQVGPVDYRRHNFDTFGWAVVTIFQLLTGENWNTVMYDAIDLYATASLFYFIALVVIGDYIILNLFLAILLDNFAGYATSQPSDREGSTKGAPKAGGSITRGKTSPESTPPQGRPGPVAESLSAAATDGADPPCHANRLGRGASGRRVAPVREEGETLGSRRGGPAEETESRGLEGTTQEAARGNSEQAPNAQGMLPLGGEVLGRAGPVAESETGDGQRGAGRGEPGEAGEVLASHRGGPHRTVSQGGDLMAGSDLPRVTLHRAMLTGGGKRGSTARDQEEIERALWFPSLICLPGRPALHPLRRWAAWIISRKWFEWTIMVLIAWSSLMLALDEPGLDPNSTLAKTIKALDVMFVTLFSIEATLKIIALGFFGSPHAYLRSPFNILDFFIVFVSILLQILESVGNSGSNLSALRALRTVRALRPMRMAVRYKGLRVVVGALFGSIPAMFNVVLVCLLFFLIFGIMGVSLLQGVFARCVDADSGDRVECYFFREDGACFSATQCEEGTLVAEATWYHSRRGIELPAYVREGMEVQTRWETHTSNFDNVAQAILALFEVATLEMWLDIMYNAIDSRSYDPDTFEQAQPIRDSRPAFAVYFIVFVIIGAFFVLNLFVGVTIDKFNEMKERDEGKHVLLTEAQSRWIAMRRMALMMGTIRRPERPPDSQIRRVCYDIYMSEAFEGGIMAVIIVNVLFMAMEHHDMSDTWVLVMFSTNIAFTVIYLLEAGVKFMALGVGRYFKDTWNRFDFLIVAISVIGIALEPTPEASAESNLGVVSLLRIFRIARVFRLIPKAKGLRTLFHTLITSLPALWNVGSMLLLFFFMYAVMGMQLFGNIKHQEFINRHANFQTFLRSMSVLFRMATGESWNGIMHDTTIVADCALILRDMPEKGLKAGTYVNGPLADAPNVTTLGLVLDEDYDNQCTFHSSVSLIYFVSFVILVAFIMFNLVIAIILDNYQIISEDESLTVNRMHMERFRDIWSRHDPGGDGKIEAAKLPIVIAELEPPLGVKGMQASPAYIQQLIMSCDIPNRNGLVTFHEVLYALSQRAALDHMPELADELKMLHVQNPDEETKFWRQLNKNVGHDPSQPPKYSVGHYHAALYVQAAVRGFLARYEIKRRLNGVLGSAQVVPDGEEAAGGEGSAGEREGREE